jgi:hypothetical protein
MKRVPHARGVAKSLRSVRSATQKALKELNLLASQRMAKGDYGAAEALAAKGKELREFQLELAALRKRWQEVSGSGGQAKATSTPLWTYYQPILQGLVQAGGECRRDQLETHVERLIGGSLQPGDRATMARGRERLRVMIRRARRPLVSEGWLEHGTGNFWRITEAGRKAAEQSPDKMQGAKT